MARICLSIVQFHLFTRSVQSIDGYYYYTHYVMPLDSIYLRQLAANQSHSKRNVYLSDVELIRNK